MCRGDACGRDQPAIREEERVLAKVKMFLAREVAAYNLEPIASVPLTFLSASASTSK